MIFQKQSIAIILACVASTASAFSVIPSSTSSAKTAIVTKPYSIANYGMQTSSPLFMSDNDVVETTEETPAEEGDSSETEKPQEDISKVAYVVNLNYGEYILLYKLVFLLFLKSTRFAYIQI